MSKRSIICAGIDTGKSRRDVALENRAQELQVENTAEGHRQLSAWLRKHKVARVGIEASGGYELAVVSQLRRDGFVVVVFQPAQVRAYAMFHLQRAKNDKIDAGLIAACTAVTKKIYPSPDPRLAPFAEIMTFIDQINEDIARLQTRQESCRDDRIEGHWNSEIRRLRALVRVERPASVSTTISPRGSILSSALTGLDCELRLPSWCACPRSAASRGNRQPP